MHIDELGASLRVPPSCSCVKHKTICTRFADWFARTEATLFPTDDYERLATTQDLEVSRSISVDIVRTFPRRAYFSDETNRASLRRILIAYAAYDRELGYAQGLNFIAGFMLWHGGSEVNSFSLLRALMRGTKKGISGRETKSPLRLSMRQLFLPDLVALKTRCFVVQQICYEAIPDVFGHLLDLGTNDGSSPDMFILLFTDVFLTLFTSTVPFLPLARIWDLFFAHGWLFLCHLCVARLYAMRSAILQADEMVVVLRLLREQPCKLIEERGKWRRQHRQSNRMWLHLTTQALAMYLTDHNVQLRKALAFTPESVCGPDVDDI